MLRCKLTFYYRDYRDESPAERLIAEAAKLEKKTRLDDWYFHWASAWQADHRGAYPTAVAEAKAAVAMAPYDTVSHADGADILIDGGVKDEAIEWAKFAVTNDPRPLKWYFFRAYSAAGKHKEGTALAEAEIIRN